MARSGHTVILASDRQRDLACEIIRRAPANAVVTIARPRRTMDQNAAMWAMLSDVSRAKPEGREHTPEVWKTLFMHACGHEVAFQNGLIDGAPFPVGFRSSKLDKQQMSDLLTFIRAWGDENGVEWSPIPGEAR